MSVSAPHVDGAGRWVRACRVIGVDAGWPIRSKLVFRGPIHRGRWTERQERLELMSISPIIVVPAFW